MAGYISKLKWKQELYRKRKLVATIFFVNCIQVFYPFYHNAAKSTFGIRQFLIKKREIDYATMQFMVTMLTNLHSFKFNIIHG